MSRVNAPQLIRNDHKTVKALFLQFEAIENRLMEGGRLTSGSDRKVALADEIFLRLAVHMKIEEEIFYSALEEHLDVNGKGLIEQCLDDYASARAIMQDLTQMTIDSREFDDIFQILRKEIESHIEFEEEKVLPLSESLMHERLDDLGSQMETRKAELMKDRDYIHEAAQNPDGGEQKRTA